MRCRWCNRTIIFVEGYPEDYWTHIDGYIRCFDRDEMSTHAEPPAEKHRFKIIDVEHYVYPGYPPDATRFIVFLCVRCGTIWRVEFRWFTTELEPKPALNTRMLYCNGTDAPGYIRDSVRT